MPKSQTKATPPSPARLARRFQVAWKNAAVRMRASAREVTACFQPLPFFCGPHPSPGLPFVLYLQDRTGPSPLTRPRTSSVLVYVLEGHLSPAPYRCCGMSSINCPLPVLGCTQPILPLASRKPFPPRALISSTDFLGSSTIKDAK